MGRHFQPFPEGHRGEDSVHPSLLWDPLERPDRPPHGSRRHSCPRGMRHMGGWHCMFWYRAWRRHYRSSHAMCCFHPLLRVRQHGSGSEHEQRENRAHFDATRQTQNHHETISSPSMSRTTLCGWRLPLCQTTSHCSSLPASWWWDIAFWAHAWWSSSSTGYCKAIYERLGPRGVPQQTGLSGYAVSNFSRNYMACLDVQYRYLVTAYQIGTTDVVQWHDETVPRSFEQTFSIWRALPPSRRTHFGHHFTTSSRRRPSPESPSVLWTSFESWQP